MKRIRKLVIFLAFLIVAMPSMAQSSAELLQEGLYAEEVEGNLDKAIKIYDKIIENETVTQSTIAQALYRKGMCYYKQKDEARARSIFNKIQAEYSSQIEIIEKIKPILKDILDFDPASIMPAETFAYIELGKPGEQIETILNMLSGTPYENPFASITQNDSSSGNDRIKTLNAFFNPSRLKELKKVNGIAVGIFGREKNNYPMAMVLDLGDSHALRGMLFAMVTAAGGQPLEAQEGMERFNIDNVGLAYDENIVIIAQPFNKLNWCIEQYKGLTPNVSLASKNENFRLVSKAGRTDDAITLWAEMDGFYKHVVNQTPSGIIDQRFLAFEHLIDLKNVNSLLANLSIRQTGIDVNANLSFKNNHNCIMYNLIRTPNLTGQGLKAIPAEAIGLLSLCLNDAEKHTNASQTLASITGLDIGRELFANIEQLNVFALPMSNESNLSKMDVHEIPFAPFAGISVTSRNPQKTNALLREVLYLLEMFSRERLPEPQTSTDLCHYPISLDRNTTLNCYLTQIENANILTFNKDTMAKCIQSIKEGKAVLNSGKLHGPISEVNDESSKVIVLNAGGAVDIAATIARLEFSNPENKIYKKIDELARLLDNSYIKLQTEELDTNLKLNISLEGLPEADKVFPVVMEISRMNIDAKLQSSKPIPSDGACVLPNSKQTLKWSLSEDGAKSYNVYFGTDKDNLPILAENTDQYPTRKIGNDKYFWRVDAIMPDGTIIEGKVWSFNTMGPIGHWPLDKPNAGIKLQGDAEIVENGGIIGGALKLDGEGDYADVNSFFLECPKITMCCWVKGHKAADWAAIAFSRAGLKDCFGLHYGQNQALHYTAIYESHVRWTGGPVIPRDEWAFVAVTVSPEKGTAYVYTPKSGMKKASNNVEHYQQKIDKLKFGWDTSLWTGDTRYFNGLIDDVRVYSYVLSEEELMQIATEIEQN